MTSIGTYQVLRDTPMEVGRANILPGVPYDGDPCPMIWPENLVTGSNAARAIFAAKINPVGEAAWNASINGVGIIPRRGMTGAFVDFREVIDLAPVAATGLQAGQSVDIMLFAEEGRMTFSDVVISYHVTLPGPQPLPRR